MTQTDFQALVSKVLSDDSFAKSLAEHPEQALNSVGITPTPEILDAIKGVDASAIRNLAASLGEEKAAG
jgi:hypothetical protein